MASGIRFPYHFASVKGVQVERDALAKKLDNIRLAVTAPPNFYPLMSRSGNRLYGILQNTPLVLVPPAAAVFYCKEAIEPFVKGVEVRPYGRGSDVEVYDGGQKLLIRLAVDFLDLEASARFVFIPDVENPASSVFRLSETE